VKYYLLKQIDLITLMFLQQQLQQEVVRYSSIKNNFLNVILKLKAAETPGEECSNDNDVTMRTRGQVLFLICQSCLWCASTFNDRFMSSDDDNVNNNKCPFCKIGNLESLPISDNESYKFDYDPKSGVILEFLDK
jgi:hypothetical protein